MKANTKIIWIIDGKVKDASKLQDVVGDVIEMAQSEHATKTYWWSMSGNEAKFSDLDIYDNTAAALSHIEHWAAHNDAFEQCAQNERLLVLGNVEQSIKEALASMNPHFMDFFGGFAKDKPIHADQSSDTIWSFEGRIVDKVMFRKAMEQLTPITQAESGCMLYWWCTDEEDHFFVLEKYLDSDAAMVHMKNSAELGKLFFGSTEVTQFTIYSKITHELADTVAGLNPIQMSPVGGFSR